MVCIACVCEPTGAILSIPITAVMRIVLSHTRHPYAVVIIRLLSGRLGGTSSSRRRYGVLCT